MKNISFLILFLLTISAHANSKIDACENITGVWKGFWSAPYSRCHYQVETNISKKNSDISLDTQLKVSSFPSRCNDSHQIIQGKCKDGRIVINYYRQITGRIENNVIRLYPEDEYIYLEKK